jgi:hypothetical protein
MKTLQIIGKLWNNEGNTYHSAEIICDYSLPTEKVFYLPFSYGYERQFVHNSIKLLVDKKMLPVGTISTRQVKELGIELIDTYTYCKKRDLIHLKKFKMSFLGRLNSSIGKTYKIKETVEAVNEEEAKSQLYNKYEHISELIIK